MESTNRGNLTQSKFFERSMPAINQVPTDSLGTTNYQQDHNANNVSHFPRENVVLSVKLIYCPMADSLTRITGYY